MQIRLRFMQEALATVFSKPRYALIAAMLSLLVFFLFITVNNIPSFISVLKITSNPVVLSEVFLTATSMIIDVSGILSFLAIVAVSILVGINISMFLFKANAVRSLGGREGFLGFGGIFGGSLSSACAACPGALISLLGVSGGLAILPFKGLEISALSIAVLLVSLYFVSKSLVDCGVCKVR